MTEMAIDKKTRKAAVSMVFYVIYVAAVSYTHLDVYKRQHSG